MLLPFSFAVESIQTPTFFAFYLHDQYQAGADGILKTDIQQFTQLEQEWTKLREHQTRFALNQLSGLESRHGLFVPDCLKHVMTLEDDQISKIEVNGSTFNETYGEWLDGKITVYIEDDCGDELACNPNCPGLHSHNENYQSSQFNFSVYSLSM